MLNCTQFSKGFFVIAALLLVFACAMPGKAWATANDACSDGTVDNSIYSKMADNGQKNFQARSAIYSSFGSANILSACNINSITNLFNTLTNFSAFGSVFGSVVTMIMTQVLTQVVRMITQVCQTIVTDVKTLVNNAINSALGGICIPLPSLGLGINMLKVGATLAPPCGSNSLSLVQVVQMAISQSQRQYQWNSMMPTTSGKTIAP